MADNKTVDIYFADDIDTLRHSTSHVMAQAVRELFPDVKLAIGPSIEEGFYYDFERDQAFTPSDLEKIEKKMEEIIKADLAFTRKEISRAEAKKYFESLGEKYKVELLKEIPDEKVSMYVTGDSKFTDLCRGPHLRSTGKIKAFKLLSVAGAYWRGSEKNKMLQRIYGTAFPSRKELDEYLNKLEEAKKRDHRKLGRELDLYSIHEQAGPGLIFWHPKAATVLKVIRRFWEDLHTSRGYQLVSIPHIACLDLWKTSGHWNFYREYLYSPMKIDEKEYLIKPMNCPGHILIYKTQTRSYRDLPVRYAEMATVYRYEKSGVLHGLMRVRGFTQDDAHIFCLPSQLEQELEDIVGMTLDFLKKFGFSEYEIYLSTMPEQFVGTEANWEKATSALKKALEKKGLKYQVDPGAGVFYGPKIDVKIKDSLGRPWQCSTIQVDFNLPERFQVEYIGEDGKPYQPIMIHRAILGSLERFFGVLLEHFGGAFPFWLAPVQARIMTITEAQVDYAGRVAETLEQAGIRVEIDDRNEKINLKIREGQIQKIPYLLIVGNKEKEAGTVGVRQYGQKDTRTVPLAGLLAQIK